MKNADDFTNNEEPSTTPVGSYDALVEMTRPLVIMKGTITPSLSFIYRDQPESLDAGNCRGDLALKRGEIIHTDLPEQQAKDDDGPTVSADLVVSSSNLRIRVYIGMS